MKKILFLTVAALGVASGAFALNPTNSFYVPKKGNFLFRGDASWGRAQDTTGTDTHTSIDGMYGLTNGVALIAGVYENPQLLGIARFIARDRTGEMKESRIPEVGIRFVPCLDKGFRLAAEMAYGFGSYGSDTTKHDYIRAKLTVGKKIGDFIFGAFADYAHYYRFAKNTTDDGWINIHNANFYGGGLVATYNVNDKTSLDLTWRHSFKDKASMRYGLFDLNVKSHYQDAIKASVTHEFRNGVYVTPYVGYTWVDKWYASAFNRNTTTFGVNVAVEF